MKSLLLAAILLFGCGPALAAPDTRPLAADEAAIIGAWEGPWGAINAVVLQSVVKDGACLKLTGSPLQLPDHRTVEATLFWGAHRLAPGFYAMVGVQWSAPYYDQYGVAGISPQAGDYWVASVAPGVVTKIGVWPVTSPYAHRYVLGAPDMDRGAQAAAALAGPANRLVSAEWTRRPVIKPDAACPAGQTDTTAR